MDRFFDKLFKSLEILMAIMLAVMVILMFVNVVMRYVLSSGFVWSEEITRICFIYLVYLGTIGAYRDNVHLGVDTLISHVPPKAKAALYICIQAIVIWVMFLLVQGSWALTVQTLHDRLSATHYPRALIFGIGVVTGLSIMLLALTNLFSLLIRKESVEALMKAKEEELDV